MEYLQEYINNYNYNYNNYGPRQSEFQLTLLFLKDINVPQKYKQKYLAQYQKAVPMDIDNYTSNANTYTNTRSSILGLSRNLEAIKENYNYKY